LLRRLGYARGHGPATLTPAGVAAAVALLEAFGGG
jgi:hypothetical protein